MGATLGHDFSRVRIHTGAAAAHAAQRVAAKAFTIGNDVVFGAGRYAPTTRAGLHLLAHELAHVAQQRGAPVAAQAELEVGEPDDPAEREADAAADRVLAGASSAPGVTPPPAPPAIRRAPATERDDEIERSQRTPGEVAATTNPPVLSIYNFAIDHALLKAKHRQAIAELADALRAAPGATRISIVGHTDSSGPDTHNARLSQLRAREAAAALGVPADVAWRGETEPVASNETVDGRSRNRRVDFRIQPNPGPPPKKEEKEKEKPPPEKTDRDFWCLRHPIICLVGLYCLIRPRSCLPGGDDGPERLPPPRRRACVSSVMRPPPIKRSDEPHYIRAHFDMRLEFINDATGCDCSCGEYLQTVQGFVTRDHGTGGRRWSDDRVKLVGGPLDRNVAREDARGGRPGMPYGHRNGVLSGNDRFQDASGKLDRQGCTYIGFDSPGAPIEPGEHVIIHMEFTGAPVDACNGRTPLGPPNRWTFDADVTRPPDGSPTSDEGPTIGPARPDAVPMPFDPDRETISSRAFRFVQEHGSRAISGRDFEDAVEIEFRELLHWRPDPPLGYLGDRASWVVSLRQRARRRLEAWREGDRTPR
jgi:outer membrane protein OmpA-like peptidoglycan-associated protein